MIIKNDFDLSKLNTFGVKAIAKKTAIITCVDDLSVLFCEGLLNRNTIIMSKASNILFTKDISGLVLLNMIWGKEIIEETESHVILRVSSGEFWPEIVHYCVKNNWGGIENLADIPGKAGAAPVQNIGAYGNELKDVIVNVNAFNLETGKSSNFNNQECEFDYRSSIFKYKYRGKFFITDIDLKLSKKHILNLAYKPLKEKFKNTNSNKIKLSDIYNTVSEIRNSKLPDPEKIGNAGSFFKNPVITKSDLDNILKKHPDAPYYELPNNLFKVPAGWLIEKCNLKGYTQGSTGVHNKQALVLVNYGNSTGNDIIKLARDIRKTVYNKFNITLEFEVNII